MNPSIRSAYDCVLTAIQRNAAPLSVEERPLIRVIELRARNFASNHGEADVQLSPYLKALMFKEKIDESPRMQNVPSVGAGL